jgi:uncharacterized protein YndB with AHSA1/START domain
MPDPIQAARHELSITRDFNAPRELVFALWVTPDHIPHWWGPRGYATVSCEVDLRPGGRWRVASRHEDGTETAETGLIREIDRPSRLTLTHAWEDADGKPGTETIVTITFADVQGKTRMTFHQVGFDSVAASEGHEIGWTESFDMMTEYLARV